MGRGQIAMRMTYETCAQLLETGHFAEMSAKRGAQCGIIFWRIGTGGQSARAVGAKARHPRHRMWIEGHESHLTHIPRHRLRGSMFERTDIGTHSAILIL